MSRAAVPASEWLGADLLDVLQALRERRLRASELVAASLARAKQLASTHRCFLAVDEAALETAARADRELDHRQQTQATVLDLLGVPMAHKDMFDRRGELLRYGSRVREGHRATRDATVIERLADAGALTVGALNMAEFALGATGHNAAFGDCCNAWNPAYIAGGSSSGSGVAVAAGAVFASLGSDTGGSVRIPASVNGMVGLKPTYGRIPRTGSMKLSPSIDVIGPIARTAADLALVLRCVAGADGADAQASRLPVEDYSAALVGHLRGVRIGIPKNYFFAVATDEIGAAMHAVLRALEASGATLVEIEVPDVEWMSELSRAVVYAEATAVHAPWLRERASRYTPQVRVRASTGLAIPAPLYFEALQLRLPLLERFVGEVFSRCDVLHTPTLPIPVPRRDETDVGSGQAMWAILAKLVHCTAPFNYLGLPAVTVPAGLDANGLPMGAQYVARPFAEALLLRVADVQQQRCPLPDKPAGESRVV